MSASPPSPPRGGGRRLCPIRFCRGQIPEHRICVSSRRSFVFLALLIVLTVLEELIVGYLHHRAFADSIAEIGGGTLHQAIATSIILLLILIPFFAFRSLAEVVGARVLFRLFFEPRRKLDVAPAKAHREGA